MAQTLDAPATAYSPKQERQLRIECAAAYRLIDHFGWTDLIYNHISVRLPGPEHRFLINPFGMRYDEIRASDLVVIDLEGNILSETEWPVNPAGFVIHSAIHEAREDAQCVIHTHTPDGTAVASLEEGLLPLSQFAMAFYNRIGYHDYEGLAVDADEKARLVQDLGSHPALMLRNHGLITVGHTVGEAFVTLHYLERACEIQIKAQSAGKVVLPRPEVCEHAARQFTPIAHERPWAALLRLLDEKSPSYKD
jgi:ribulose-5-phosphate 4-epimerase/fuculose-1-phosphate aldolase